MSNTLTQRFSTQHGPQRSNSSDNSPPSSFHRMSSSSSSVKSHAKRPSLTNWLNRTGSSSKSGNKASLPVQVSEPKVMRGLDAFDQRFRSSTLGTGATVVGTPQEALDRVPGVHLEPYPEEEEDGATTSDECELGRKPMLAAIQYDDEAELPFPPESPEQDPPCLPEFTQSQPNLLSSKPPCPSRMPPPPPPALRPSLKQTSTAGSLQARDYDKLPAVSAHLSIPAPSPQPPFSAILLSPAAPIDRTKIVVHIETETQTFRTTVNTVTSRSSYLATYMEQVLNMAPTTPSAKPEDDASVYSDDASVFHRFLASEGVLSASACNLKLFLDRPSAPYKHILAYLRAPNTVPSFPALPRSARLPLEKGVNINIQELLDLRDEAVYLGMQELYTLCTDELRLGLAEQSRKHMRDWSASEASRYSGGSVVDRAESDRAQMVTPQSMEKRRSRSLTRPSHHSQPSRDGSGLVNNNTIKRPSHSRNDSQVSARWI